MAEHRELNERERRARINALKRSPAYRLAFEDREFLNRDELRPVRLMLEALKAELILDQHGIRSTIVVFGGTRIQPKEQIEESIRELEEQVARHPTNPELARKLQGARSLLEKAHYYEEARRFAQIVSRSCQVEGVCDFTIITGGGPGIMEAANRGAWEVGAKTIGLNITLPEEQEPNPYVTPELCFQFRYFAIRKLHFLLRAKALVFFPGGFGTIDELFDALTLIQTKKMPRLPVLLVGEAFWRRAVDLEFLVDEGTIDPEDALLVAYVETAEEAWQRIVDFYREKAAQEAREAVQRRTRKRARPLSDWHNGREQVRATELLGSLSLTPEPVSSPPANNRSSPPAR
jgi:uncharacterized protein (TIGR00730 family)